MRIEELRIGNYVEYNGCTGIVYAVHSPMPCEDEHFRDIGIVELILGGIVTARIDEIQPIPLTEELLLKFGFVYGGCVNQDGDDVEWFSIENKKSEWVLDVNFQPIDLGVKILQYELKYLHQLQNLYFTIEGEELGFKK